LFYSAYYIIIITIIIIIIITIIIIINVTRSIYVMLLSLRWVKIFICTPSPCTRRTFAIIDFLEKTPFVTFKGAQHHYLQAKDANKLTLCMCIITAKSRIISKLHVGPLTCGGNV